jgi:hypothetical protein
MLDLWNHSFGHGANWETYAVGKEACDGALDCR